MVGLCCVVVREERCFNVEVAYENNVYFLKQKIKQELVYPGRALDLDLYLALENGKWLIAGAVEEGELTKTIQELTQKGKRLLSEVTIGEYFVGKDEEKKPVIAPGQVHVLVVAPEYAVGSMGSGKRDLLQLRGGIVEDVIEGVGSLMKKQRTGGTSWQISKLSTTKINQLGYQSELVPLLAIDDVSLLPDHPGFNWTPGIPESNRIHVEGYKEYFAAVLKDTKHLSIKTELNLDVPVGKPQRLLKGKPDLCIIRDKCLLRNEIAMVIELKAGSKEETLSAANFAQTMGYFLVANTLFECEKNRPSPIGLLTNLYDAWCFVWLNPEGKICYAYTNEHNELLDRKTALYYMRKHCNYVNSCIQDQALSMRNVGHVTPRDPHVVFGSIPAGTLEKYSVEYDDNMADVLETDEEIRLYEMAKRLRNTTAFDVPIEFPSFMYS
ncbi:hypothetical protein LEN26_018467 [Aphanomyces euteiches]|nr:hypothetical protein LEN26_018467 [Aphanomyces euteiches]